jgi:hypothetical protein
MNCRKIIGTALSLAGAMLFASASFAQAPQIVGVGSSGIFTTVGIAAVSADPITGAAASCGTHFWTAGSAIAQGIDARNGSIPAEGGNIWVAWDNDTTPTIVCAYLSVDSVVGQRLFLGQTASGNATLNLTAAATSTAGANKVSFVKDFCGAGPGCAGLPSAVYTLLNGKHFNVAFTDIRPEDGQYAYARASCNRSGVTDATCFGYGPAGGIGTAIQSSYSQTSAQVVAYAISGTDPFSGLAIPAIKTIPIGGAPVVIFYNTSDATAGGLGNLLPTNINKTTLANFFSGNIGINDQLVGFSTGTPKALHVVIREPVSGTYNTFEFQGVHTRDGHGGDYTQEYGFGPGTPNCFTPPNPATFVPPVASGCANPADAVGAQGATYGGFRTRAIGTGEMVNAVSSANNPNSIGYAFFGLGTFGGKPNLKYMTLDGADPLYPNYSSTNGAFPACTGFFNATPAFSCTGPLPTYDNVKSGSYRIWSTVRAVIYASYTNPISGPSVPGLIQAGQDQAHVNIPDFVPSVYCANAACSSLVDGFPAFRSHYGISGISANNGGTGYCAPDQTAPNCIEEGGDMAGVPFIDIQEKDYFNLTGNSFVTWIE